MIVALRGKVKADSSADEYFLSSRNLPWYSIALSTIATNIQGYQFLGMMGSAYLFGLNIPPIFAQLVAASLFDINAKNFFNH